MNWLACHLERHPGQTGQVWGIWHGGINYAPLDSEGSLETWASLQDAIIEAGNRMQCGHRFKNHFEYVNSEPVDALTPGVEEDSRVEIFLAKPRPDEYGITSYIPDLVLVFDEEVGEYVIEDLSFSITTGRVR